MYLSPFILRTMGAIAKIKELLKPFPNLKVDEDAFGFSVLPANESGFVVSIRENQSDCTVYFIEKLFPDVLTKGWCWHEEYDEKNAIFAFLHGLTRVARLRVTSRGKVDCSFALEINRDENWLRVTEISRPFLWQPRGEPSIRYLQNDLISIEDSLALQSQILKDRELIQ
jgi:hypothetical protein